MKSKVISLVFNIKRKINFKFFVKLVEIEIRRGVLKILRRYCNKSMIL